MKASQIRSEARQKLASKWGKSALITLIFAVLTYIISFVLNLVPFLGYVASLVISVPLSYGLIVSMFKLNDDEEVGYLDFFNNGFSNFGKTWSVALQTILKLIVPIILVVISVVIVMVGAVGQNEALTAIGYILYIASLIYAIIKEYTYSLAYYVLNDNPDMTGKEAVEKSAELMQGNVWALFCLRLSFIGWSILSVFTLCIGLLWLMPYMKVAEINFYRNLTNAK